jgi:hypothetical protein
MGFWEHCKGMDQTENNDKMKINLNRKASKKLSWLKNSQFGKNNENNHFLNPTFINCALVFYDLL